MVFAMCYSENGDTNQYFLPGFFHPERLTRFPHVADLDDFHVRLCGPLANQQRRAGIKLQDILIQNLQETRVAGSATELLIFSSDT